MQPLVNMKITNMGRNHGHCNYAGLNITGNTAAKQLKDLYGKNKTKGNILNSSFPGTSAVILLNYWKLTWSFCQITFHKQMLVALLFVLFIFQASFIQHSALEMLESLKTRI